MEAILNLDDLNVVVGHPQKGVYSNRVKVIRSLMNRRISNGPRVEPWRRIPETTLFGAEDCPLITTI